MPAKKRRFVRLRQKEMESGFYKRVLGIAVPIAIHNLMISAINMADVFMVGQLGEEAIAALGISNQLMFLLILFLFGMGSGGQIFVSQFYGKGDLLNLRRVMGVILGLGICVSFAAFVGARFFPEAIVGLFSHDAPVVKYACEYLRIVSWSYIFTAVSFIYQVVLRSTDSPRLPVYSCAMALVINVFFNWILIFGHLGFPAMGIEGAALATLIARIAETIFTLAYAYIRNLAAAAKFSELISAKKDLLKQLFVTAMPVFFNEMTWALGILALNWIYAKLGTESIAAINISESVTKLFFAAFIGIGNAGAVVLGHDIGACVESEKVWKTSVRLVKLAISTGLFLSLLVFLFTDPILSVYNISESVYDLAYKSTLVWIFFLPIVAFNNLNIVGILRSGGDTKAAFLIDVGALWVIAVPLSFAGVAAFGLPLYWVLVLSKSEEAIKFIWGFKRYVSKKWIKNLVKELN